MSKINDYILTENQFNILLEYTKGLSTNVVQKLFNFISKEKKQSKNRAEILDKIKELSPFLSIPKGFETYLLELYLLNFRKDGNYSDLTKDNFIDPRKGNPKRTYNTLSDLYSKALMPFKGSNLEGYWTEDRNGKEMYIIKSYGWYPIYIFKDDQWYEVTKRYSSSTGRQMSNVNPVEWDDNSMDKVILLTPEEMEMIIRGYSYEEVKKKKAERLKKMEPELISKRKTSKTSYGYGNEGPHLKISFKIVSIDTEGEKPVVNVDIYDVKKIERGQVSPIGNYLKGEVPNVDKEYVERKVEQRLLEKFRDFLGPRYRYNEKLRDTHNLKFNFNHLIK